MSGHSKWANIKHRKQSVDAKKGAAYAQSSKEISVAVRLGGSDPEFNFRLRNCIDKAKAIGMPNDNIQRAIDKVASNNAHGEQFEEILYEGYGPNGIAVLVEAATDNRNRTASELRTIFGKFGGNLGESGCVSWGFKHLGLISIPIEQPDKRVLSVDNLIDSIDFDWEIEDFDLNSDSENYFLFTQFKNLEQALNKTKLKFDCSAEIIYLPTNQVQLSEAETIDKLDKLLDKLESLDDVQSVYHNALISPT